MKTNINIALLILSILAAIGPACTKTRGDAYKDYLKGGEIVYPARVDSVIVQGGYKRIQLSVILGNDPLVNKVRIYWNNQADSVNVGVDHTKDTVPVIIPNLVEGNYNFTIFTFDSANNKSVVFNASGTVYGDSYASSLANRTIKSIVQSKNGLQIMLTWGEAAGGELGTEISYLGNDGTARQIIVPSTETVTTLPDYKELSKLTYRSLYKPDSTAFENFSPPMAEITLPAFERELDKAGFQLVVLPTDVQEGGYGWLQQYMWDEKYNPPGFATRNQVPCWFTVDVGQSAALSRFKVWQANDRLFQLESVKTFELYGSNNPDPDGSWTSWTKLGDYTSIKPSGLPVGQNSQTDIDYAKAGEEFTAPGGTPPYRYYRFKLLTNWGNRSFMTIEEFTFYTHDQ
ncbi:DUF4998 domain-containing protein [Paraflavitalea devenefica]|uniref:DUF4998 domain-containing protein n=1 Tax=Paraflavitalea devenefica TaxID=2716334 RepID=UPI0014240345|nr:DUF4998 domain-containing protein [Paraflavitalea devenefica]